VVICCEKESPAIDDQEEKEELKPGEKEKDGKAEDTPPEQNGEKGRRSRPVTLHWAGDARRGI
jgi:hypothetical protein